MKARTFLVILFTLIFITCTVIGIAEDFDWPRWRGPSGDGISMETGWNPKALSEDPKILWKTNVGLGYSNVTIKDLCPCSSNTNSLFLPTNSSILVCFNRRFI